MVAWFRALMPKEEKFFPLFARQSELLVAGAEALRAMLAGGDAVAQHCQTVMDREQEADDITREVLLAVRRTFITPFDRSDITDLIKSMDDAIDQMQKTAKTITLFEHAQLRAARCSRWATSIVEAARLTAEAIPLLQRDRRGNAGAPQRHRRADHPRRRQRRRPLRRRPEGALPAATAATDPMAFIVGAEIYDHLEKVVDRFEDVANEISGILIEHL